MKRLIACLITAAIFMAGCAEHYNAVNGSNPPQVVVSDNGDKIDQRNFDDACAKIGRSVVNVQYIGNGKAQALVTCDRR